MLESLPFEILLREPRTESMKVVSNFARQVGDFAALSLTDLKLMALTYELEVEEIGDNKHIRLEPLRPSVMETNTTGASHSTSGAAKSSTSGQKGDSAHWPSRVITSLGDSCCSDSQDGSHVHEGHADYVSKDEKLRELGDEGATEADGASALAETLASSVTFSDEQQEAQTGPPLSDTDFPSLGDDDDFPVLALSESENTTPVSKTDEAKVEKPESIFSWSKVAAAPAPARNEIDGKQYAPKVTTVGGKGQNLDSAGDATRSGDDGDVEGSTKVPVMSGEGDATSRIIGANSTRQGAIAAKDFEDDGQGWISPSNFQAHRANSGADILLGDSSSSSRKKNKNSKTRVEKVACMTNDFSMQNTLIQMNLHIMSLDGMIVRRVKQFVLRCNGCYTIQYDVDKLFCRKCGGSYLSRVAASIDSRTGERKLHLRKDYKHDLRGMKYSMPAPGKQGRHEGEILLREDQLMGGAWRQKAVRVNKNLRSAFGENIVSDLGLHVNKGTAIRVGLGSRSRNPNAVKGRERRGKKKK